MNELEQQRRDLMQQNRELYEYIVALETAKALDRIGDSLSGISHGAANLVWAESSRHKDRAKQMT